MRLEPSQRKDKKYQVVFDDGKRVSFGAKNYNDFTTFPEDIRDERKKLYLQRHKKEGWTDPKKPGTLARYILWNKPSLSASFEDYKNRFHLK